MEKGLKTLQTAARMAQRKASAAYLPIGGREGTPYQTSDSGIGFGSDAETEAGHAASTHEANSWHAADQIHQQEQQEHVRSRSLPQPLPLYQPPQAIRRTFDSASAKIINPPGEPPLPAREISGSKQSCSPDCQNGRGGLSIQAVLSS